MAKKSNIKFLTKDVSPVVEVKFANLNKPNTRFNEKGIYDVQLIFKGEDEEKVKVLFDKLLIDGQKQLLEAAETPKNLKASNVADTPTKLVDQAKPCGKAMQERNRCIRMAQITSGLSGNSDKSYRLAWGKACDEVVRRISGMTLSCETVEPAKPADEIIEAAPELSSRKIELERIDKKLNDVVERAEAREFREKIKAHAKLTEVTIDPRFQLTLAALTGLLARSETMMVGEKACAIADEVLAELRKDGAK